jgi:predicted DNA-binding transcriptional regulator
MNKDRAIGAAILAGSVVGIVVYAWLVYAFPVVVLQVTAFVAVAGVLVVLAWIGWTMVTTPPPVPFEPEPTFTQTETVAGSEQKGQ